MGVPDARKRRYEKVVSMAEALDMSPWLRRLGLRDGDKQIAIYRRWEGIVGVHLANHTQPIRFQKGTLTVAVSSAAWLQELTMMKPRILKNIAKEFGSEYVKDLRLQNADFRIGPPNS
jgi:predicted nucleic acid-binding Zn ribbon protein